MENRHAVAIAIAVIAGFGGGLLVANRIQEGKSRRQVELAVEEARREFEARRGISAASEVPEPVAPATSASTPAAAPQLPGVSGGSGKDMVDRLVRNKYGSDNPPTPVASPTPDATSTAAAGSAAEKPSEGDRPFPKVLELEHTDDGTDIRVSGTVKNMGSGPCLNVFVSIVARDARGITIANRQSVTFPKDIEPYSLGRFDAEFPSASGATLFSAQAVCR